MGLAYAEQHWDVKAGWDALLIIEDCEFFMLWTFFLPCTHHVDFYGIVEIDPVTLKRAPQYPMWKTMCQFFFVSLPIMLLASLCMGFMALSQFWIEDYLLQSYPIDSYIHFVPSIVQAMLVAILTIFYDRFATYLTDLENHKTQSQYEKYRVIKLIVLEFVNNFFSLLYIGEGRMHTQSSSIIMARFS